MLSRTVGFPESGWRAWLLPHGLPRPGLTQAPTRIHPSQPGWVSGSACPKITPLPESESRDDLLHMLAKSESPFAPSRRYLSGSGLNGHSGERYLTALAAMGSCARSITLLGALPCVPPPGLRRLLSAPAACRSFPTLSLPILPRMSGPLPPRLSRCFRSFPSSRHRPCSR